jgi:nucleotide-binding universal stress UspA family protein
VPFIGASRTLGDCVAIAWKDSPEAARAVAGALPLLRRAREVHVLAWGEEESPSATGAVLDLAQYLRLHGIEASFHREQREPGELGELLLSRIADLGADLLVAGCYGHSRVREWVMGGVTQTLLRAMTVPVLMAH